MGTVVIWGRRRHVSQVKAALPDSRHDSPLAGARRNWSGSMASHLPCERADTSYTLGVFVVHVAYRF
jgi:hypothetical protein